MEFDRDDQDKCNEISRRCAEAMSMIAGSAVSMARSPSIMANAYRHKFPGLLKIDLAMAHKAFSDCGLGNSTVTIEAGNGSVTVVIDTLKCVPVPHIPDSEPLIPVVFPQKKNKKTSTCGIVLAFLFLFLAVGFVYFQRLKPIVNSH